EPYPIDTMDVAGDDHALLDDCVLRPSLEGPPLGVLDLPFGLAAPAGDGVAAVKFGLDELHLDRPDGLAVGEWVDVHPVLSHEAHDDLAEMQHRLGLAPVIVLGWLQGRVGVDARVRPQGGVSLPDFIGPAFHHRRAERDLLPVRTAAALA